MGKPQGGASALHLVRLEALFRIAMLFSLSKE